MKKPLTLALLLLTASTQAAAPKERAMGTSEEKISEFAAFAVPAGWTSAERVEQGDPQLRLEKGLHAINIRLAGGTISRYRTAGDFLAGFEARSIGGKQAEKADTAVVSGARALIYRRGVPVTLPPPGEGGPAAMTSEEFCVVPAGTRFFILTYSYGDTIPDPAYDGKKAWRKFLKEFRVLKKR